MHSRKNAIYLGYSDEELERKVSSEGCNTGVGHWQYWTSELYSVGRLYRDHAFYPKIFPLFVYSDHGIHPTSELAQHEIDNESEVHFTFNPERINKNTKVDKQLYLIGHPWIAYRKKKNYKPSASAKGTLVFVSHSTTAVEWIEKDRDGYFADLKKLPEKFKPLVLCMHMHDINKKYHLQYRKYGLPIITCGNTSSINFVDEFYKTTTQFKYASSNTAGSQLYYCIEMGMPYFLFGDTPDFLNKSDTNLPLGVLKQKNETAIRIHEEEQTLFRDMADQVSPEQKIFAERVLGLGSNLRRPQFIFIVWRQLFKNTKKFVKIHLTIIRDKFSKVG